jgi:heterodisulfide reductase subunit B
VSKPELPEKLSKEILASARQHGAQAIATACPLCQFNLDFPQRPAISSSNADALPIFYFTQLMAVALGLPQDVWGLQSHYVQPNHIFANT